MKIRNKLHQKISTKIEIYNKFLSFSHSLSLQLQWNDLMNKWIQLINEWTYNGMRERAIETEIVKNKNKSMSRPTAIATTIKCSRKKKQKKNKNKAINWIYSNS